MPLSSYGGRLNIAAATKKIDVDNRISLRYYYRIADNVFKRADIFREEENVIDLYVMLLRFSSLVTETIPYHQEYRVSPRTNKRYLKRKLISALTELEELKPVVQSKLQDLHQLNKQQNFRQSETQSSVECPATRDDYSGTQSLQPVTNQYGYQGPNALSPSKSTRESLQRIGARSTPTPPVGFAVSSSKADDPVWLRPEFDHLEDEAINPSRVASLPFDCDAIATLDFFQALILFILVYIFFLSL